MRSLGAHEARVAVIVALVIAAGGCSRLRAAPKADASADASAASGGASGAERGGGSGGSGSARPAPPPRR
ncbi:MAG: hypothetical protein KF795_06620 [Labilithrix sp.]|nr:hypothetical protein [Labilithrix sp.]